ncbi:MAG: class I SAM-dependent methyltransferase, partial [Planctomycetota bacterium]|nr:class I SAM-dependent methyltransferase [Planctomycetota bacterium]
VWSRGVIVRMLKRVLEPEVMDTPEDATEYDSMDHSEVNRVFVDDLLAFAGAGGLTGRILDVGAGTAQIPIELCRRVADCSVLAADLSPSMIELARANVLTADLTDHISPELIDAKRLPYDDGAFQAVISNSIVHHIPDPTAVLAESVRATAAGGLLFFRDLLRPEDDAAVRRLVRHYAGNDTAYQRKLFDDSLRASLTLCEVRDIVTEFGFDPMSVHTTSDRHWTWQARR